MEAASTKAIRRPRADSQRNREKLLVAAAAVFRETGGEGTLEAVARRATVGIGTLYRHFPTREALFEAVYRREIDQLAELARDLEGSGDPVENLRGFLHAMVGLIATKKGMIRALAIVLDGSCEITNYSQATLLSAMQRVHAPAIAAGRLRPDVSAEDVLQTVVGMCIARRDERWEAAVSRLSDVFLDGLRIDRA
ncbi:TetR/AcrR family transcriptional regulator [Jiella sonneratiae]|uniref:TetR/AcrR family transcriptional regulator n=1 Tax=Jiella sonneratiae TaxID=2816856 RepID=A0ABS3IZD0_9HYPH|nr:TetR family transcriptional regulator [Jiella sonneratiae]MBO0902773.1 TetR/AcrR family transcriptional regulator [Jiella sonneratiae]